jgi:hypothetical protein
VAQRLRGHATGADGLHNSVAWTVALGFLFGLFSKTLHEKLRDGFKAFVKA